MELYVSRCVDVDVDSLVFNYVAPEDVAGDGGASGAAVDVDSGGAVRRCIADVGAVAGEVVEEDDVVVEVIGRQAEVRANVAVEGDSGNAVVEEFVVDDEIFGDEAESAAVGEDAYACTGAWDFVSIVDGFVIGDGVANDAQMWCVGAEGRGVRCEGDAAVEGVVLDGVSGDEVVVGLAGVIAEENSAGVTLDDVVGHG